jgi:hypothetical protein
VVLSNESKPLASDMTLSGGMDGFGAAGVDAGRAEVPGWVRRLERRVEDANAEGAAVEQTGWAREGRAEGAGDLLRAVKRNVPGRVRRVGRVGEGGGSGCSSQTLTPGNLVPVPDGSEYIKEKDWNYLHFFFLGRGSSSDSSYGCVD